MDYNKFYKEKATGEYLGRFLFAHQSDVDGIGRGRDGTIYYFTTNNAREWQYKYGIMKKYSNLFDLINPELPDDIQETDEKK